MEFNPSIALSVAYTESTYNPKAIGGQGEIGLFQVKPQYALGYTRAQLFNPEINIRVGITRLKEEQKYCTHRGYLEWLTCYNMGRTAARKLKHPSLFPYVVKVRNNISKTIVLN